jgi:hypothetical protein
MHTYTFPPNSLARSSLPDLSIPLPLSLSTSFSVVRLPPVLSLLAPNRVMITPLTT